MPKTQFIKANEIYIFELRSGKSIICKVEEISTNKLFVSNPMLIYPTNENQLGFGPAVFTDPKEMACNIRIDAIDLEYVPDAGIIEAYSNYVSRLTSSIIQLDNSIKKVQLNG